MQGRKEKWGVSLENISPLLYDDLFKRYEVKKQNKRRRMLRKTPSHCLNVSQCEEEWAFVREDILIRHV